MDRRADFRIKSWGSSLTIAAIIRRVLWWEWAFWTALCALALDLRDASFGWLPLLAPLSWLAARWLMFALEMTLSLGLARLAPEQREMHSALPASTAPGAAMPTAPHRPPPEARIGPIALARCISIEALNWLRWFIFGQAFARFAPAPNPSRGTGPVVLLVHGLGCNGTIWRRVHARLATEGWRVETVDLLPALGPFELYVDQLHATIEMLRVRHGVDRVFGVGHSMGGVALRAYAAQYGAARIAGLVTVGSPHRGTWFAHAFTPPNVREMRIGCDFLAALADAEARRADALHTCLWSWHDNVVTPQTSAQLPGARSIVVAGIGHLSLIFDPRSIELLVGALADAVLADAMRADTDAQMPTPSLRFTAM